jgi:hypothetical protein
MEKKQMSTITPKHFAPDVRNLLANTQIIQIETRRPGAQAPTRRTIIWVVVVGDNVYVRSVRGQAGCWYQNLKANPVAVVHVDGHRISGRAVPVTDDVAIKQVNDAYRLKYYNDPYMPAMMRDEILPTTLRLEPQ